MSWDISVMSVPAHFQSVQEMDDDWKPPSLGLQSDVIEQINAAVQGIDWSDPTWGMLLRDGYSIEFNMGRNEESDGFMLHVRGGGDVIPVIKRICEKNGWRAIDCSTGDFMEFGEASTASWNDWQAYRDKIIGDKG